MCEGVDAVGHNVVEHAGTKVNVDEHNVVDDTSGEVCEKDNTANLNVHVLVGAIVEAVDFFCWLRVHNVDLVGAEVDTVEHVAWSCFLRGGHMLSRKGNCDI